jgi:succinyl-diaminopimelate desuccinylase
MKKPNMQDFLIKLISYNTVTGNNQEIQACLEYIASLLPADRYDTQIIVNKGIPNLYAKSKEGNSPILLNGHIDVVPADESQFKVIIKDNKLYGRGAVDMKGAVAVMINVLQNMNGYDLLLTGDEETGGNDGMKYLLGSGQIKQYVYAIAGEPTDLVLATTEKGLLRVDAIFRGKSAHAAKPWEGINPLFRLQKMISYLQENYSYLNEEWKTSITPTLVKMTNVQNQIAESAILGIDSRFIPEDDSDKILEMLKEQVDEIKVLLLDPPLYEKPSKYSDILLKYIGKPAARMHWATDARYFEDTPAVIYGPSGEGMHSASEYVDLDSLDTMYKALSHLAQNLG